MLAIECILNLRTVSREILCDIHCYTARSLVYFRMLSFWNDVSYLDLLDRVQEEKCLTMMSCKIL